MHQWRLFKLAVIFLTRLPVKVTGQVTDDEINRATGYFPLVGAVLGSFLYIMFILTNQLVTVELAILLTLAVGLIATGAFHEDGFADTWDGFGGGWRVNDKLNIMKDSRLGTYGACALFVLLLVKYETLTHIAKVPFLLLSALVSGHVLSRAIAISIIPALPYVQEDLHSKVKPVAKTISASSQGIALCTSFIIFLLLWIYTLSLLEITVLFLLLLCVRSLCIYWFKKQLGGYTGDCLGAAQQYTELSIYLFFTTKVLT